MMICAMCNGLGEVDSGGFSERGYPLNATCPDCKGTGDDGWRIDRLAFVRRIASLQNSRDYADEFEAQRLTRIIDRLLDELDWDEKLHGDAPEVGA